MTEDLDWFDAEDDPWACPTCGQPVYWGEGVQYNGDDGTPHDCRAEATRATKRIMDRFLRSHP